VGDCEDPCEVCNRETHTCGPRCDAATEVCCTDAAGPGVCQKGTCCPGEPCEGGGCQECGVDPSTGVATCTDKCFPHICCTADIPDPADWFCAAGECCPSGQGCDTGEVCCGTGADAVCEQGPNCGCDSDRDCNVCEICNAGTCEPSKAGAPCNGHVGDSDDTVGDGICCADATGALICVLAETCECDDFCGPVTTGINTGSFYCCTEPDYTICCTGSESECCGGPAGRECQPSGHCCEATSPYYCPTSDVCCAVPCDGDGLCPEVGICIPEGESCPSANGIDCCTGLSCCGGQCCASANCCEGGTVCCGLACDRCDQTDTCVEDCRVGLCLCLEGQTCNPETGICDPIPSCEPECACSDDDGSPINDGLDCNGGLAAGGGICGCGYCIVPLDGCPCGCAGDPECIECVGGGVCELINQGLRCNEGAGICADEWCVDAPPCAGDGQPCTFDADCCEGVCLNDTCTLEATLCAPRDNSCAVVLECCNLTDECCQLTGDAGPICHKEGSCNPD